VAAVELMIPGPFHAPLAKPLCTRESTLLNGDGRL
jgi:hypothetical protein